MTSLKWASFFFCFFFWINYSIWIRVVCTFLAVQHERAPRPYNFPLDGITGRSSDGINGVYQIPPPLEGPRYGTLAVDNSHSNIYERNISTIFRPAYVLDRIFFTKYTCNLCAWFDDSNSINGWWVFQRHVPATQPTQVIKEHRCQCSRIILSMNKNANY